MKVNPKSRQLLYCVFTALMAAMIFVTTYFLKIPIATPAGQTMLKVSNILVLLGGMLFGGVYGGLAAGLGNAMYDLLDPVYIASAPLTFIKFFAMAFVCGIISNWGDKEPSIKRRAAGAVSGAVLYWILYITESIVKLMTAGSAFSAAAAACAPKMITSGIDQSVAVIGSLLLIVPISKAVSKYLPKNIKSSEETAKKHDID